MNKYQLGILFTAVAIILFSLVFVRQSYVYERQESERDITKLLEFSLTCATHRLSSEYGSANDYHIISTTFFNSLSAMGNKESILSGRITPSDYYPYVPIMICLEDRYYHIGSFNGTKYEWGEQQYYPGSKLLSESSRDEIINELEIIINTKLKQYHDMRNLPDTTYLISDYTSRTLGETKGAIRKLSYFSIWFLLFRCL